MLTSPVPIPYVLSANISYSHLSTLWELISPVSIPTLWVLISSGPVPGKSVLISALTYSECWFLLPPTQIVSVRILCPHLTTQWLLAPPLTKWALPTFAPHFSTVCLYSLSHPPTLWMLISPVHILPPSENLYSVVPSSTWWVLIYPAYNSLHNECWYPLPLSSHIMLISSALIIPPSKCLYPLFPSSDLVSADIPCPYFPTCWLLTSPAHTLPHSECLFHCYALPHSEWWFHVPTCPRPPTVLRVPAPS